MPVSAKTNASGRRATSYDVARLAGVSQSAVSRCFADGGKVAPKTRERIVKIAEELDYRPNALAQGLILGRSGLVALLISSLTLHYPEVLDELTRRLTANDLRILLFSFDAESDVDAALAQLWRHNIDGAICAAHLSDDQTRLFAKHRVPLVLYNRSADLVSAASVCCDSMTGERELVGRLLSAGHQRFAIITGTEDSYVGQERCRGAMMGLAAAGFNHIPIERGDFSYGSGRAAMIALLRQHDRLDAVICVNDLMAIGAIDAARDVFGLNVPDEISIVGFDGSDAATWSAYQVTSIRQPNQRMIEAAVSMLVERIDEPNLPAERRSFAGELVAGRSAKIGLES